MDKKILKKLQNKHGTTYSFYTNYLATNFKRLLKQTKDYFINLIWDSVKEDFAAKAELL